MDSGAGERDNAGMSAPRLSTIQTPNSLRTVLIVGVAFWTAHYLLMSLRLLFFDKLELSSGEIALRRFPIHLGGLILSLGIFGVMCLLRHRPFAWRAAVAAALVLPAAALYGLITDVIMWYAWPSDRKSVV